MIIFDEYNLKARVAPVFVVLIPAILATAAWAPEALSLKLGSLATAVSVGFSMLIAQFGRNSGKQKEQGLWDSWGGPPTTQLLRHQNTRFNQVLRQRYHSRLRELRADLRMPTAEEEARNPGAADQVYGAAPRYLIGGTRDTKKFPLIFKENVNYGFLRNLWGLKPFGLIVAGVGLSACTLQIWLVYRAGHLISASAGGGALISFALLLTWLFWVTPNTVSVAADAYAERLFEACEQLSATTAIAKTRDESQPPLQRTSTCH
jgi:hypothetical protein